MLIDQQQLNVDISLQNVIREEKQLFCIQKIWTLISKAVSKRSMCILFVLQLLFKVTYTRALSVEKFLFPLLFFEQQAQHTSQSKSQKIQCDLINTTTNKVVETLRDSAVSQKKDQVIGDQLEKAILKPLHINKEGSLEKQHSDFSVQFNSCCVENKTMFHVCSCSEQAESYCETRDVGSQCEPNVRHFAVQSLNILQESSVEVAEVSVQVETSVFSTGTQYVEPGKKYFKTKNNLVGKSTSPHPNKALPAVIVEPVGTIATTVPQQTSIQQNTLADQRQTDFAHVPENPVDTGQEISGVLDISAGQFPNLVELDYSQIPADLLQQILNNTATTTSTQLQVKPSGSDNKPTNLKPMYFVVDGHATANNNTQYVEELDSQITDGQEYQVGILIP